MFTAADQLKFEYAAKLRDEISELSRELGQRQPASRREAQRQPTRTWTLASNDARALAGRALELGAVAAQPLSRRARWSSTHASISSAACRLPELWRQPHVPAVRDRRRRVAAVVERYSECLVVQQQIPLTAADIKRRFRGKSLDELVGSKAYNKALADRPEGFRRAAHDARGRGARHGSSLRGGADRRRLLSLRRPASPPPPPARHAKSGAGVKPAPLKRAAAGRGMAAPRPTRLRAMPPPFKARPSADRIEMPLPRPPVSRSSSRPATPRWTGCSRPVMASPRGPSA